MTSPETSPRWRIGADIGGTFTDLIALGPDGEVVPAKVLSTPPSFGTGVLDAIEAASEIQTIDSAAVDAVLHGTTVATNAILEHRGSRTALVTTRGFRDVVELGRLRRPFLYDLGWQKPTPLAPRRYRFELDERTAADGSELVPLDWAQVDGLAVTLADHEVGAVAVCLLHSYARPDLERAVAERLRDLLPGVHVTASVDVAPQPHEYERTSTALVNAYVGPTVARYVTDLASSLAERGIEAPFLIMQSSGGLLEAGEVARRPVQIIESGPAAGVIAVQKLAEHMGLDNVVAFDMGGTTAKATLIEKGEPLVSDDYEVGGGMNAARSFSGGGGYAVRVPSIDIAEVGAGGGSIVSVDAAGALKIGPESASSRPGPACYGLGGDRPTLTDANVLLGYLSPHALAGGRVGIQPELAEKVLLGIGDRLGIDARAAARGAYEVAVSSMTKAVKAVTSERGRDPRDSVMVGFGGAGPLYAAELAKELGIATVVVPMQTGLFSSLGLLVADLERQAVRSCRDIADDPGSILRELSALVDDVQRELDDAEADGVGRGVQTIEPMLDMRYRGQRFELRVAVPSLDASGLDAARAAFHVEHERTYGRRAGDELVEVVNARVRGRIKNEVTIDRALGLRDRVPSSSASRLLWFDGGVEAAVLNRAAVPETPIDGPLVIEDMDSTTLVPPGATVSRDALGSLVITWPGLLTTPSEDHR